MDINEIISKIKKFFSEDALGYGKKIGDFFNPAVKFILRHKVISIIVTILLVLVSGVLIVGNHYLSKINYDDGSNSPVVYTQVALVKLGTGESLDLKNAKLQSDGTYLLPDGRIYRPDGSIVNTDGSIIFKDGSYITAEGVAVLSDGTTVYTDGLVVFQDGSYISGSGIVADREGVATFTNSSRAHISTFTIDKSGRIVIKDEYQGRFSDTGTMINGVLTSTNILTQNVDKVVLSAAIGENKPAYEDIFGTTKPSNKKPQKLEELDDNDDVINSVKNSNSEVKKKLESNDELIRQNLNDNEIWYHKDVKNILLMGIDNGSKSFPYGRSDAMIIVSINQKTKQVKLISLSRAAYVAIEGYANTRLSHAHGYAGAALAKRTIENNYKIRIDNYVSTTFKAFEAMIDAIGGVNITLSGAEAKALARHIKAAGLTYNGAGNYKLNGSLALNYVRLRKIDTDRQRTARQRKILTALANRAKNMSLGELNNMLNKVLPYITTDLSKGEIVGQLVNVPSYLSKPFEQHVLPHKSSALTLIDNFEVITIDWKDETKYTHDLIYKGLTPSYYKR